MERTPDAVAVVYEGRSLSYADLNGRPISWRTICAQGVRPDQRVGICVERSLEMVVGLLGILKAGGAYVPLDPSYPAERLTYMLSDSEPVAVLSHAPARGVLETALAGSPERGRSSIWMRARGLVAGSAEPGCAGAGPAQRTPGICDLHLRVYGTTQRGDDRAPRLVQLSVAWMQRAGIAPAMCCVAEDLVHL